MLTNPETIDGVSLATDSDGYVLLDPPQPEDRAGDLVSRYSHLAEAQAMRAHRAAAAERAEREANRRRDEAAWYALVTFGEVGQGWKGERFVGQGLAERARLASLGSEIMGTGTCSAARVVRCETRAQAEGATIADELPVVVHA